VSPPRAEPSRRERFERQVLVHLDAAYNLARWLLRDTVDAEDAVQEASLRAFRFFEDQAGPSPKAWFMAIVRNACMDAISATRRERAGEPFDEEIHGGALSEHLPQHETPEMLLARASDARLLHACLAELPLEFREALILREMEELSYREISVIVGVPIGTVMSRLARGREQLARRVQAATRRKSS
jgi:RNA polymerase sigma factor (sigma-70 family)